MEDEVQIRSDIAAIKERNSRVEADKAWEVSWARRLFITTVTYLAAGVWLLSINDSLPWLKAFVPAVAYVLSTMTLSALKKWWVRKSRK